ncbi:unnamed protein product [Heterobilharzia americana]|nr:unnamed protein product [Heterobilharzia americana]
MHYGPNNKLIPIVEDYTKSSLSSKNGTHEIFDSDGKQSVNFHALQNTKKSQKHVRVSDTPVKPVSNQAADLIRFEQSKLPCRVKPAFAFEQYEAEPDEYFDPASQLLSKKSAERVARRFKHTGILETQEERVIHLMMKMTIIVKKDQLEVNQISMNLQILLTKIEIDLHGLIKNLRSLCTSSPKDKESGSEDEDIINNQVPLQLPFSTFGVSGARLTHLFAELRERANLDLFQVPQTTNNLNPVSGSSGSNTTSNPAQSSLFDADALADELERHERMLKEFDDFLSDFQNIEPFGIVRPAVPTEAARQQPSGCVTVVGSNNVTTATALLTTRTPHPVSEM